MYNVSNVTKIKEAYNKAWQDENRNLKLTMTLNGTELNLANVLDCITWEWDGCSTGYGVGNIFYSMVTFSLYKDVFVQEMMEVAFVISIEITVDGVKQWLDIPFGKYVVTNVEKTKIQSKVTCYDKFYNALKFLFVPNKSDKQYTSTELIKEISGTLNMPIHNVPTYNLANEDIVITNEDGTTTTQKGTNFDGWTYAEMLGLVAGACGGNFFFDRNGEMRFQKGLVPSDVVLTEKQFTEPNMKVNIYSKTGIKITKRNDMEKVVVGETLAEGNPKLYIIENPLFTDETANNLLTILSNISYQPIATSCIGVMPLHLYPLDTITINYEGKDYIVPLMKLMYKFASGVSGSFESYVETLTEATKFSGGGLNGKIDTIQGSVAQMELLVATTVVASNVNASNIEALQVKTEQLQTNYAEINNLVSGNLTAQNILTGSITSDRLNIADGFITNAMINSVDAGKVRTGSIDTSLVTIQSENGNLVLSDNTIQISDGTNVRVQIGKDSTGDYNLYVWDSTGKLMWSATGLTEDAIKTQIIRDDMIKDDANISAEKLNIESLFTALNEDGSNTLKASKILLDTENQTLEVAFNNMKTSQSDLEETTQTLTTQLNVQQGSIESLVQETEIIKGEQTTLKNNYSQIDQDVDSINLTVASIQSDVNGKVSQDSVVSAINMSTEGIAINGNRIELTGDTIVISNGVSTTLEKYLETNDLTQDGLVAILNGAGDGLYLIDGELLINADYIQTGTLRADLIKVQVDETSNLLPFNYVTMDNAINTNDFHISEFSNGYPYAEIGLPIYNSGGDVDCLLVPFGYSDITVESGKSYWFSCEVLAQWGNDTKLDNGTGGTSTATSGSKYGLATGDNLNIVLYSGDTATNMASDGYVELACINDFNSGINVEEREGYDGVYSRAWTRLVGRLDSKATYTGNLWIHIDCSGFQPGDYGYFYIKNLQLVDASQNDESIQLDYIQQLKEKRIELTDGIYYTNIVGVDGIKMKNGYVTGDYPLSRRGFTIDDNGFKCRSITGSENAFMGVNQSYYSYDGGSSGQITGYDDIYGFGCTDIVNGSREGIFIGVHEGFQKPNDTEYGRADIYSYRKYDTTALDDWTDWELLGARIEPLGLVRRDSSCNISTNGLFITGDASNTDFTGGTVYHGSVIFSEPLYSTTSDGQIININKDNKRIYFGNTKTQVTIETGTAFHVAYNGKTYNLGALLASSASTVSLDDEDVQQPLIMQIVSQLKKENEDLKAKNQELEERLARLEALLLGE